MCMGRGEGGVIFIKNSFIFMPIFILASSLCCGMYEFVNASELVGAHEYE